MARPAGGYHIDGKRVPGGSTIAGVIGEPGGLMFWAYAQGKEHQRLVDAGEPAPTGLYDKRDEAADTGTVAHELVEQWILHHTPPGSTGDVAEQHSITEDMAASSLLAFQAYMSWEKQSKLEIVETEMPMISKVHRFGGTPDAIGLLDGQYCLLDWKTSNGVYADHLVQLALYGILVRECTDYDLSGGFHLLRFSKEHGDFTHHYWRDLSDAARAGLLCRELYELRKQLKKRTK